MTDVGVEGRSQNALPAAVDWQRGAIRDALAASDTLVTEVLLPTADDTKAMQQLVIAKQMMRQYAGP